MSFEFLESANMLVKLFWFCAVGGTLFFGLRTILMFIGGDSGGDFDGLDGDLDGGTHSDAAFELISINSLTSFVMMFGWAGLTAAVQFKQDNVTSLIVAISVGMFAMYVIASMFKMAGKLVSKGAQFNIKDTIGLNANVYQQIPADGRGRVNVSMSGGMLKELDAVSADKQEIASFKTVKIVEVIDNQTVSVRQV